MIRGPIKNGTIWDSIKAIRPVKGRTRDEQGTK